MAKKALPPGLKQPAVEAITSGGFSEVNDPFHTGAKRLQQAEVEVTEFVASLEAARAEADRDGWISADAMLAEMDQIIRETAEHAP